MVKYGYIILMCPIKSLFAHKLHDQKPSGRHGFQQDPDAFEPETQVRRAIPPGIRTWESQIYRDFSFFFCGG